MRHGLASDRCRDRHGHAWRYAYDEQHLLVEDTDRTGLTWHFVFDSQRRGIEAWGDIPGRVDWSLAGELPTHLDDGETRWKGIHHCKVSYWDVGFTEVADFSQTRRFHGNEHGTLDKQVIGGAVVTATYREDGWMTSRTNERNGTERFERNARGSVVRYTDPLGHVTTIERDANDLPIEIVDARGGAHRLERDARGNVTLYVDPTGAATSRRYDARGLVLEEISPNGERTAFSYDAHGNCAEVTLANGATWRFRHDRLGRRIAEVDPFGAETRYRWSARGDLLAVIDAMGAETRYAYDGEHHLTELVDANGGVTSFAWGGYHRLCLRRDANGHEVRLGYSPEGELIEVRNEVGEVHTLRRDGSGKVLEEVTFDGRTIRYGYDAAADLVVRSHGDRDRVRLVYDLAGRVIQREYGDGTIECLDHDELGALVRVAWPGGEVQLDRDAAGRVVRERQILDGVEHRVESAHDLEGERVLRKTSLGHTEAVERGLFGARRRTVLDGRVVVEHASDLLGREVARALSGGGRIESAYDRMGRIERRRAMGAPREVRVGPGEPAWVGPRPENVTVDMAYRYDPAGELSASWDQRWGWTSYRYDPVGQLLARVPEQARAEVFRFDAAGNSHEDGSDAPLREYAPGNRLICKGNARYRWDAEGRLAEKSVEDPETGARRAWRYTWSHAGLLESVTTPEGERVEFRYDPFGRRVEKRVGKAPASALRAYAPRSVTRFVWDGDVLVHEISRRARADGDPVVEVKTYCFEDDGFAPVAHCDGGEWFHYVNDPIGTPERLVDERGEVACALRREAWGRTEAAPGARTSTAIRFPGQYEDPETGLCYNRFRYYDPEVGRFVSSDPIGLDGDINAFAYTNNAIGWADPLGLYKSGPLNPNLLGKDKAGKKTKNLTEWRRCVSKSDLKGERNKFLGVDHVKVGEGKWRSRDGTRQFRIKPDDFLGKHGIGYPTVTNAPHVHFEFLSPNKSGTGFDVTKNVHVPLSWLLLLVMILLRKSGKRSIRFEFDRVGALDLEAAFGEVPRPVLALVDRTLFGGRQARRGGFVEIPFHVLSDFDDSGMILFFSADKVLLRLDTDSVDYVRHRLRKCDPGGFFPAEIGEVSLGESEDVVSLYGEYREPLCPV
ncbi:uncharacterized protein SOCEGT47_082910 [Sorangium cellulosum]|uniref:Teneurin-like YD-shell domain-containing protein n=1 Tax=Sorangium cellulosum TaxID=56 RepID=A0A4P2QES8_SORCE|nr:uncharacterized protein SOCEGT47_082910 [Sorangium cellulosum]